MARTDNGGEGENGGGGGGSIQTWGISGYVRNRKDEGLPNVTIDLRGSDGAPLEQETTTAKGHYVFGNLVSGSYRMELLVPAGYKSVEPATKEVELKGFNKSVDFRIEAETSQTPPPEPPASPTLVEMRLIGGFSFDGSQIVRVPVGKGGIPGIPSELLPPPATQPEYMRFIDENGSDDNPFKVQEDGSSLDVLRRTPGRFRLLAPHQDGQLTLRSSFFYQDDRRAYLASPVEYINPFEVMHAVFTGAVSLPVNLELFKRRCLWFAPHFHPRVRDLVSALGSAGVTGLLSLGTQQKADAGAVMIDGAEKSVPAGAEFIAKYAPNVTFKVGAPSLLLPFGFAMPREDVDFDGRGAFSLYNWELFFHAPLLIASQLNKNQRFEEAQKWFHYIFDPTDNSDGPEPARFWRTRPFYEAGQGKPIQDLLELLADKTDFSQAKQELVTQIQQWVKNPFKPHAVAKWRPRAYQFSVVMKYVDNLLAWGDQLFRRDTIESINEATQLYVLAAQILGRRPESIPPRTKAQVHNYRTLEPKLDEFSNALVPAENVIPTSPTNGTAWGQQTPPLPTLYTLYFCVPHNDRLLEYWDKVADRLFKIRHCMNIEGVVRQLPLFEPPIDPGLLVKAAAAGVDISSVLSDMNAPLPHYRFNVMSQKATELCTEVKSLGAALLSALEKRDAEALALLRSGHEISVLESMRRAKEQQIEEAKTTIEGLTRNLQMAQARQTYYCDLLSATEQISLSSQSPQSLEQRLSSASQSVSQQLAQLAVDASPPQIRQFVGAMNKMTEDFQQRARKLLQDTLSLPSQQQAGEEKVTLPISRFEKKQLDELKFADEKHKKAMDYELLAQGLAMIPDFTLGTQGMASSPVVQASIGGTLLSRYVSLQANQYNYEAHDHTYRANLNSIVGGYQRRAGEWLHQAELALKETEQIGQQIQAAGIRLAIATHELNNHDKQIKNAKEVDAFMRDKYSNHELYDWMVGQISGVYFQSYQLAYDVAKRTERAYRHELGLNDSNFIQFGYWDSLKKGLLAGERLHHDLKRMEVAYLDQNRREYEITKHVSLAQLDPLALVRLKQTGGCFVSVPEALFDLDYAGHYMRRIKSVGVSIPCVTGPYAGVNCTITLVKSSLRHVSALLNGSQYARDLQNDDPRFTDSVGAIQSIVTSSGQSDAGLFEPNLRDERYQPFEGAGAISDWRIELPMEFRQFDYDTISDVILHVRYTAREGGGLLKQQALKELKSAVNEIAAGEDGKGLARLFSAKHEFPSEYHRFLQGGAGEQELPLPLAKERFPYLLHNRTIQVNRVELLMELSDDLVSEDPSGTEFKLTAPDGSTTIDFELSTASKLGAIVPVAKDLPENQRQQVHSDTERSTWNLKVTSVAQALEDVEATGRINPAAIEDIGLIVHYAVT